MKVYQKSHQAGVPDPLLSQVEYAYDAAGNRTTETSYRDLSGAVPADPVVTQYETERSGPHLKGVLPKSLLVVSNFE